MSIQGCRPLIFFVGVLGLCSGCAGVPAPPEAADGYPPGVSTSSNSNQYEGRPFDRLTGHRSPNTPANDGSGVIPTSAVVPADAWPAGSGSALSSTAQQPDDSGFDLSDLAPENIIKTIKEVTGQKPNEGAAQAHFKEGTALLEQKMYDEASGRFKAAAKRWPDSVLEEDALYWLGECYFWSDQYPKAQDTYEKLLEKYDNSRHLDTVAGRLFSIGRYWEQLHDADEQWSIAPNLTDKKRPTFDTLGNALTAYETVYMKDPIGEWADDAVMATAYAHFRRGRYEDASYYFDLLRTEYADSKHLLHALELGLQSKLATYQGPLYDGTPLEEADEVAKQMATQLAGQLSLEQQRRLDEVRNRIREQLAERDWAYAQFYETKTQFGAARIYYQYILQDYPSTEVAQRARERLDQIRDKPDRPPNRFYWLTNVFAPLEAAR